MLEEGKMKKVLFVVHTLQVGGAEKVLVNLLKYIDKKKFDVTVLALVDDGVYVNDIKNIKGVKYKYVFDSFFKKSRSDGNHRHHKITVKVMHFLWQSGSGKIADENLHGGCGLHHRRATKYIYKTAGKHRKPGMQIRKYRYCRRKQYMKCRNWCSSFPKNTGWWCICIIRRI